MAELTIAGGELLLASEDDRVITARLLPFGEQGRTNLGRFTVGPGVLTLPPDASVAIMNDGHRRQVPLAAGIVYAERADGVHASWRLAKSPEGDAALAGIKDGTRRAVSVEADVVVVDGKAVSGRIFGAALVSPGEQPAFPSALLMATEADAVDDPEDPTTSAYSDMYKDPVSGDVIESETTTTEEDETDPETGITTTTTTTTTVKTITPGTPAEGSTPVGAAQPVATDPLLAERSPSGVPAALLGRRPKGKATAAPTMDTRTLFAMLAKAAPSHRNGSWDQSILEKLRGDRAVTGTLLAELTDVTFDAAGSPSDMIVPQWIGQLWSGRSYVRRYAPLFGTGTLTSDKVKGWRWKTKPVVEKYDGNKTDVPSGPIETEPYDVDAQGFAMAHDVDRRYRDFPVPEFWEGYFAAGTESYAKQSDLYIPDELFTVANHAVTDITAGAVPTGVSPVMVKIVDGALAMLEEDLPSFALVTLEDYRDLLLTREQDNLAFLNAALGLEEGTIESFRVVPSSHAGLSATKASLVGSKSAATVHELPGAPIRIEGLDVARGGIDPGLFGYTALVVHNPKALVRVKPKAA